MSVNVTITKKSGEAIFPPGGGFMSNGTAMSDATQLQQIYSQLDWAEAMCVLKEQTIRDTLKLGDKQLTLHVGFNRNDLFLYESCSGVQIEFAELR